MGLTPETRVTRTIETVHAKAGPPTQIRRQIVHNDHVIGHLERLDTVLIGDRGAVTDNGVVIFSVRGTAKAGQAPQSPPLSRG